MNSIAFRSRTPRLLSGVLSLTLFLVPATTFAAAVVPFTLTNTLPANDDGSTAAVALGIGGASGVNFFGQSFTSVYVNNNGNVTFQQPLGQYTPNGLATGVGFPIIAPFFADVDTRGTGSGLTMYGNATYNGQSAFVVDWLNVGYYEAHTDKLNSFQLILVDRPDTGAGNFDIEFNYNQIQWETGDASSGSGGLGGVSAAVGYSNGLFGAQNVYYQLPGSLVNGALLDGGPDSLIGSSLNSTVLGRYDFQVRNGQVVPTVPEPMSIGLFGIGLLGVWVGKKKLVRR
jgi:hypothetical protein